MRSFLVLSFAVVMTTQASAQSYYCDRPSEPYIPSGYAADYDQMERTRSEVDDYVDEMNDYLECLSSEHSDASSEADDVIDEWNRAVSSFNNQ